MLLGLTCSGCSLFGDGLRGLDFETLDQSADLIRVIAPSGNGRTYVTTVLRSQREYEGFATRQGFRRELAAVDWARHSVVGFADQAIPSGESRMYRVPSILRIRSGGDTMEVEYGFTSLVMPGPEYPGSPVYASHLVLVPALDERIVNFRIDFDSS